MIDATRTIPNALFQLWNPEFNPQTIHVHARMLCDAFDRCGDRDHDDVHVWFGKVGYPKRPGDMLPHVDVLREQARADGLRLFVSDFRSLHAMHVDDIRCETAADGSIMQIPAPEGNAPQYYEDYGVLYWFRVRDIALLSDELQPTMSTLAELEDVTGKQLDLYASRGYEYPIPVRLDPKRDLAMRLDESRRIPGLAASVSSGLPRGVHDCMKRLDADLAPDFRHLPDDIRVFLSDGDFNYRLERDDYSSATLQLGKAYEVMVKRHLLPPLKEWVAHHADRPVVISVGKRRFKLEEIRPEDKFVTAPALIHDLFLHKIVRDTPKVFGDIHQSRFGVEFPKLYNAVCNPARHVRAISRKEAAPLYRRTLAARETSWILELEQIRERLAEWRKER